MFLHLGRLPENLPRDVEVTEMTHRGDPALAYILSVEEMEREGYEGIISLTHPDTFRFSEEILATYLGMFLWIRGASVSPVSRRYPFLSSKIRDRKILQHRTLLGNPNPDVLLVGDRHNPNFPRTYESAFGPWAGSGQWLLRSIPRSRRRDIAMCNSFCESISEIYLTLRRPRVVALGRYAQDRCKDESVPCEYLPHPAYARRFHHSLSPDYGRALFDTEIWGKTLGKSA